MHADCPFCTLPASRVLRCDALVLVVEDGFPVSPGHTLFIPRRHVATLWEATADERGAIWRALEERRAELDGTLRPPPDGYNVGVNVGAAAGQTVMHLHVHLIPRWSGDVPDPRGGVRWVVPAKANYLAGPSHGSPERAPSLSVGAPADPLLTHVGPLIDRAERIDIVAAFVQLSGLRLLDDGLLAAVRRGATVRLITGDYLHVTPAHALRCLLDWTERAVALGSVEEGSGAPAAPHAGDAATEARQPAGSFEARVVEVERLEAVSFHPKAWIFEGSGFGAAFVGSSNVSEPALQTGLEWNLRVDRARDPAAYERVAAAFEDLWQSSRVLSDAWVSQYASRAPETGGRTQPMEVQEEPLPAPPVPHSVQAEALESLARSRASGRSRALVVMATGLGKTWLAAFDVLAHADASGLVTPRILWLAHRAELLTQARETLRRLLPAGRFGMFVGPLDDLEAPAVFASVQKLSRPEHLLRLAPDAFDYVVVDEAHHTAADSYRRILSRLGGAFVLGLTATPDRADEADILGLFDDHEAFRCDLGDGIRRDLLAPFVYQGLRDTTDYAPIPWRNGRFDPAVLERAVQTEQRMQTLWQAWGEHPGTRTIVFCCTIAHCDYVARWLGDRGIRVAALHSGPGSAERQTSLDALAAGALDAVCAVDLLNEGIDVPSADRVVMLRPTESPVVFLQQLGRGLRKAEGKERLQVIDFVGNHRVFLERVRTLLSLGERPTGLRDYLTGRRSPDLPPGCSVSIALEAVELMQRLLPRDDKSELVRAYRERREAHGVRPTAGEMVRLGHGRRSLRSLGGWLHFVREEGDLTGAEEAAFAHRAPWFDSLERTAMTKCFKMVLLLTLLDADALWAGMALDELAARAHGVVARSPELYSDIADAKELGPNPRHPAPEARLRYWRKNPVAAWTGDGAGAERWFRVEGDRLSFVVNAPADEAARAGFEALTRELADMRLADYRRRLGSAVAVGSAFEAVVGAHRGDPRLELPDRAKVPGIPTDWMPVRLPDGALWDFRFGKAAITAARRPGTQTNALPDLLRRFFGLAAGRPGSALHVRFMPTPDGWAVEPVGARVVVLAARGAVVAFPTLRAAAGPEGTRLAGDPDAAAVRLPGEHDAQDDFAVRASGDSMDGGSAPICDGDWVVMRYARGLGLGALEGRVALVAIGSSVEGETFHLKRVARRDGRWELRSDNPAHRAIPATEDMRVIARWVGTIRPEDLAPAPGTRLADDELVEAFGLTIPPVAPASRVDGHLFLLLDRKGLLSAPDRLPMLVERRNPGETAYVLTRTATEAWTYVGVARHAGTGWGFPAVDFATWRALGEGRGASRTPEPAWLEDAEALAGALLRRFPAGAMAGGPGKAVRVLGPAPRGGVRIDGGPGGFAERTVTLTDLAWALRAVQIAEREGGVADEAQVNRLRYLDGTPKGSTRWIDTGWALVLVSAARG